MSSVTRIAGVFGFHAAQGGLFLGQAALGFIVTLLFLALSLLRFPLLLALLFTERHRFATLDVARNLPAIGQVALALRPFAGFLAAALVLGLPRLAQLALHALGDEVTEDADLVRDRDSLQNGLLQAGFSPAEINEILQLTDRLAA